MSGDLLELHNATEGGAHHETPTAIIAVNWIGFFILFLSSVILCYKLMMFKGPAEQPVDYFFGYREAKMLPVYVNLFAAVAYWLKVSSHANGDVGLIKTLEELKYAEYIWTCPLLTIDLLWTLNLPYKFTFGANILVCIICAMFASLFPAPARYMWFVFGSILFAVTWTAIVTLVRKRLEQFYSSHIYSKNIRKETKSMLRTALFAYFSLWVAYPLLWILLEVNLIGHTISHCLHVLLDCSAKSAYGFAMLRFQLSSERREFLLDDLTNTQPLVLETVAASKQLSNDDEDDDEGKDQDVVDYSAVVVKRGAAASPRIGTRRPSTQLARATPKATRLLSPLMSPMRSVPVGPGTIEPFNHGVERSRALSRPDSPDDAPPPRVRRISIEPRAAASAARRRSVEPGMDGGGIYHSQQVVQQQNTIQQLSALNEQLTKLLQQQSHGSVMGPIHSPSGGRSGHGVDDGSNSSLYVPPYRWDGQDSGVQMSHRPDGGREIGTS